MEVTVFVSTIIPSKNSNKEKNWSARCIDSTKSSWAICIKIQFDQLAHSFSTNLWPGFGINKNIWMMMVLYMFNPNKKKLYCPLHYLRELEIFVSRVSVNLIPLKLKNLSFPTHFQLKTWMHNCHSFFCYSPVSTMKSPTLLLPSMQSSVWVAPTKILEILWSWHRHRLLTNRF